MTSDPSRYAYRLLIEYDGTAYVGWQRQAVGVSIQGQLARALRQVLGGESVNVLASGRTDSGVHALGQVVGFRSTTLRSDLALQRGLNSVLPRDIACRGAQRVGLEFDACRDARYKVYRYRILDMGERSPLRERWVWHKRGPLDIAAMKRAAACLVGRHDFTSFRAAGSDAATSVRTVRAIGITRQADELRLLVGGEGFLRHMVRIMVGTLVQVGLGRMRAEDMMRVLSARDRAAAGMTAPAHGLCLMGVAYDDHEERRLETLINEGGTAEPDGA